MPPATLRIPGFVNAHSHAFQRALRGVVERVDRAHPHDDFWTWREAMYAAAGRLDPDSARAVALLAYREMVAAGYVAVGEFHYVHHRPDGTPYAPPNAMALATAAAADEAGIDQVLLMTAYERAGRGPPPTPGQRRFCDPSVAVYLERVDALAQERPGRVGLAPHSVRAVSRPWLEEIGRYAERPAWSCTSTPASSAARSRSAWPSTAAARSSCWPTRACSTARTTIVHATHASDAELDLLAAARRIRLPVPDDRGEPRRRLPAGAAPVRAGIRVCIGSDSNTVIDPVVELREIEAVARRKAERRNVLVPAGDDGPTGYLLDIGSRCGAEALGLEPPSAEIELDLPTPSSPASAVGDVAAALIFGGSAAALRPLRTELERTPAMDFALSPS